MFSVKGVFANLIDKAVKKSGSNTLDFARKVVPLPIKRRISRLLTNEMPLDEGLITSKCGHKFIAIKEPVFLQVRYEGTYEKQLSMVVAQLVDAGDTAVDIGANFGWYSVLLASEVGADGKVFSFEPNENIYPTLFQNIKNNNYSDRVNLKQCGIGGDVSREVLSAGEAESAIGYFDTNNNVSKDDANCVDIYPLDDLMVDYIGNISFIKVDVEGFEPFVMKGSKNIWGSDHPPAMLMEFNMEALERQNVDIDDFIQVLQNMPASIYQISSGHLVMKTQIKRENADLIFLPTKGKFKRSIESLSLDA